MSPTGSLKAKKTTNLLLLVVCFIISFTFQLAAKSLPNPVLFELSNNSSVTKASWRNELSQQLKKPPSNSPRSAVKRRRRPIGSKRKLRRPISDQERLYKHVISNEQLTRPDLSQVPINITVRLILIKIQELIERNEVLETTVRIQLGWQDRRLSWNKSEYGGLDEILLPSASVWKPDLTIINSVGDVYSVIRDDRFEIKVVDNGQLWWHPTGVLRTFCKLSLTYYPYDRQKCPFIVESPTFDHRFLRLKLRHGKNPVKLNMYVPSETWQLSKAFGTSQKMRVGSSTYFSRVEFWLVLDRARLYHTINFILPCFIVSLIQTVFFFLPVTHPQRVGSTTVTMLSVMVFQSMVVEQLPQTSESVPLLSIYIDLIILVSATSVCASVFSALCQFNHDQLIPPPSWCCCKCGHSEKNKQTKTTDELDITKPEDAFAQPPFTLTKKAETSDEKTALSISSVQTPYFTPERTATQRPLATLRDTTEPVLHQHTEDKNILKEIRSEQPWRTSSLNKDRLRSKRRSAIYYEWDGMTTYSKGKNSERKLSECRDYSFSRISNQANDNGSEDSAPTVWLDILKCTDRILNCICALAITLGPAIIFGIIPNMVEYQDYPEPVGENFLLLE